MKNICVNCGMQFYSSRPRKDCSSACRYQIYKLKNLDAELKRKRDWYYSEWKKNSSKLRIINRRSRLKSQYGISLEKYMEMLAEQKGTCAICKKEESQKSNKRGVTDSLRVDHCHRTGKIRGLLCSKCNFGIAQFNDDPVLLKRAIRYLEKASCG